MPIMASRTLGDSSANARILANMTLRSLDGGEAGVSSRVALNNAYRLLESYRSSVFFGSGSPQDCSATGVSLSSNHIADRNVKDVRLAIDAAREDVFKGESKDKALDFVTNVLREIAYPSGKHNLKSEDVSKVREFFMKLLDRLSKR